MKDLRSARELARAMVGIGVAHGLAVTCELTDMEQPLGRAVGNSLEIAEAIAALHGDGPPDLTQLARVAGAEMLVRARRVLHAKVGDRVERGQTYADVHLAGKPGDADAIAMVRDAYRWSARRVPRRRLILGRIASR